MTSHPDTFIINDIITALIDALPHSQDRRLVVTSMTIAETVAALNRRRNELQMPDDEYKLVVARLLSSEAKNFKEKTKWPRWR